GAGAGPRCRQGLLRSEHRAPHAGFRGVERGAAEATCRAAGRARCDLTMVREYPDRPIVAVGAIVFDSAGRVLLGGRGRPPAQGRWSVPGGAVEAGETLAEACAREVREETGLEVEVGSLCEVVERVTRDPDGRVRFHYVILDYAARVSGGTLRAGSDG